MTYLPILLILYYLAGWFLSYTTDHYSWIDFIWATSFLIVIVTLLSQESSPPLLLLGLLITAWSLRLSSLLLPRLLTHREDPRYVALKQDWGSKSAQRFLGLYLLECCLTLLLCIPLYVQRASGEQALSLIHCAGALFFIAALLGEALADKQLRAFKTQTEGRNGVCKTGLWKYSRHPNYFFEVLIWFSYAIYTCGADHAYLSLLPTVVMFLLLTRVTGIPYAEKQSLARHGELYRDYQRSTNKLFPWFPKKDTL